MPAAPFHDTLTDKVVAIGGSDNHLPCFLFIFFLNFSAQRRQECGRLPASCHTAARFPYSVST